MWYLKILDMYLPPIYGGWAGVWIAWILPEIYKPPAPSTSWAAVKILFQTWAIGRCRWWKWHTVQRIFSFFFPFISHYIPLSQYRWLYIFQFLSHYPRNNNGNIQPDTTSFLKPDVWWLYQGPVGRHQEECSPKSPAKFLLEKMESFDLSFIQWIPYHLRT